MLINVTKEISYLTHYLKKQYAPSSRELMKLAPPAAPVKVTV